MVGFHPISELRGVCSSTYELDGEWSLQVLRVIVFHVCLLIKPTGQRWCSILHLLLMPCSTSRHSATPYLTPKQCHLSLQTRYSLSELALQPFLPQTILTILLVPNSIVQIIQPCLDTSNKDVQGRGLMCLRASG